MKKLQLFLILATTMLLASCAGDSSLPLVFRNYEKNANAQGPEGVPASLELTLPIPIGEGEQQTNVANAIKELISRSSLAEEIGAPEGETLEAIGENFFERFRKGVSKGELETLCVYHLQIISPYRNAQCAVLEVSDGVYGNGGPRESVWIVRLSDGRMMTPQEVSTMTRDDLIQLAQQYANEQEKEDISLNLEDFWLWPIAEQCKIKAQTGTHFYHDFVVPTESVLPYLTNEGKKLFGLDSTGLIEDNK